QQADGMTVHTCPRDGFVEALHLERAGPDEEFADADNEDLGQDEDDEEDEDRESDTMFDEESAVMTLRMKALSRRGPSHANVDYETEYDCYSQRSEDDGFSRSYRHYVTCRANKEPFPLEKLPPEVRRMIFRLAMPDDRFEPLHESEYDWNDKYDGRMLGFDDCMEEQTEPQAIPDSLFEIPGFIANEALAVFHNEVYFRMDFSPFGIRTRDHLTDRLENFKDHEELAKWTEFRTRRKYHLNIKSNAVRWAGGRDVYQDPCSYNDGSYRIKEWIRLVSDELLAKDIIQRLIITAPCRCALKAAGLFPNNETCIFDLFKPLKRIRVPNPVILSLHNDRRKTGIENPCTKPACLQLKHNIQAQLGRLDGKPLSEREATWKACKMRYLDDKRLEKKAPRNQDSLYDNLYTDIGKVWQTLSGIHPWGETFEEAVQGFQKRLEECVQAREERRGQERKERLEKERGEELEKEREEEQQPEK
ncbi:MAG: hypothetical protein Q9198_002246, partial [Flavoplaca austrocitrina]